MLTFANEGEALQHNFVGGRATTEHEGSSFCICNPYYPPVYYPSDVHWIIAVAASGESLTLEDGSVWKISSYDASKIRGWSSQDALMITQNNAWGSRYLYRIVNQNLNCAVAANLYLNPINDDAHARYVVSIDTIHGELVLSDQTRWKVSSWDSSPFKEWRLNDAVIVGYNSGWDSSCRGLLINVSLKKNQSVRAEQF